MSRSGIWRTLGIDATDDPKVIRKAYADRLRAMDVDRDVDGFARLRGARDMALRQVASARTADPALDSPDPLAGQPHEELALLERSGEPQSTVADQDEAIATAAAPEAAPLEAGPEERLGELLFPGGVPSQEPMSAADETEALQCLRAAMARAETAGIDAQQHAEEVLAHWLRSAWPRSAPLLEDAADGFRWHEEAGTLGERPSVRFLNERLRGMRFHAAVQERRHPLHRAWAELSRPGPRTLLSRLRASGGDIDTLLRGIRERYPEVESYLDPQRVYSWETRTRANAIRIGVRVAIGLYLAFQLVLFFSHVSDPPPVGTIPDAPVTASPQAVSAEVAEIFGPGVTPVDVAAMHDQLDSEIRATALLIERGDDGAPEARLIQHVRRLTQFAAANVDFALLVRIKQIKLEQLRVLRQQRGASACAAYGNDLAFPQDVIVTTVLRDKERALAADLLRGGELLEVGTKELPQHAYIPGELFAAAERDAGLGRDEAARAAKREGADSAVCGFAIALLQHILRKPSAVSPDLLRMS